MARRGGEQLAAAAWAGEDGELLKLLAAKPAVAAVPDAAGRLPLHVALLSGKVGPDALLALLAAHTPAASAADRRGCTPLHLAVGGLLGSAVGLSVGDRRAWPPVASA